MVTFPGRSELMNITSCFKSSRLLYQRLPRCNKSPPSLGFLVKLISNLVRHHGWRLYGEALTIRSCALKKMKNNAISLMQSRMWAWRDKILSQNHKLSPLEEHNPYWLFRLAQNHKLSPLEDYNPCWFSKAKGDEEKILAGQQDKWLRVEICRGTWVDSVR